MKEVIFRISSDIWGGWRTKINIDNCNSLDDIIDKVMNNLYTTLKNNYFEKLEDQLKERASQMHIHNYTFGQIKSGAPNMEYFVCDHC
jgi:hypothetical protein